MNKNFSSIGCINSIESNHYYEGGLLNYKKNGKGTEKTNDHSYIGDFVDNHKNGMGIINFLKSEDIFEGEFKDNKIHNGKYTWKENKNTYEGFFEGNKMHGEGIYRYSSGIGNMYKGNYKNGKKHGFGTIMENDKVIYQGEFCEGNPHGCGVRYDKIGKKIEVEMENGKRINNKIKANKSAKKIGLSK